MALVTDGRMSGASGKVPAAIHVSPEALAEEPAGARMRDGDRIRLDAVAGTLDALVDAAEWAARTGDDRRRGRRDQRPRPGASSSAAAPQRAERRTGAITWL